MKKTISPSSRFRRDLRRILKGSKAAIVEQRLEEVISLLERGEQMPERFQDHPLSGSWSDYRDCHILPDMLLLYRNLSAQAIQLARLGSHSDLFG